MKTFRRILGEQLTQYRKQAELSVLSLEEKSGISRQSIYDIEAGEQNVTADNYQVLLAACGVTPEEWLNGLPQSSSEIPQDLFRMLKIITSRGNDELIGALRVHLDALADKALKKTRASPSPEHGMAGGQATGGGPLGRRKPKAS